MIYCDFYENKIENGTAPAALVIASGTNAGASWLWQHLFAASGKVAGALRGPSRSSWSVKGALRGPSDLEQVQGSFQGRICDVEQVQDRSGAGFKKLKRSRIVPVEGLWR